MSEMDFHIKNILHSIDELHQEVEEELGLMMMQEMLKLW